MSRIAPDLIERIRTHRARVGVVGIPVDPLYLSLGAPNRAHADVWQPEPAEVVA